MYLVSVAAKLNRCVALDDPSTTLLGVPTAKSLAKQCTVVGRPFFSFPFSYQVFSSDMPAKTMIFDQRVRTPHDSGSAPHNTISFNPQGHLLILVRFGNLAGKINVFDQRTL